MLANYKGLENTRHRLPLMKTRGRRIHVAIAGVQPLVELGLEPRRPFALAVIDLFRRDSK
jgi:hypothetical protein